RAYFNNENISHCIWHSVNIFQGYIAINRTVLENKSFPASFRYLGKALGIISLIPPLSQIVLVLVIVWSL
ncbi:MAG TPA: hypothetical protein VKA92_11560, partial [Segetibacter sp.]|nr:hypothetical protein [Segetibacter sp.]